MTWPESGWAQGVPCITLQKGFLGVHNKQWQKVWIYSHWFRCHSLPFHWNTLQVTSSTILIGWASTEEEGTNHLILAKYSEIRYINDYGWTVQRLIPFMVAAWKRRIAVLRWVGTKNGQRRTTTPGTDVSHSPSGTTPPAVMNSSLVGGLDWSTLWSCSSVGAIFWAIWAAPFFERRSTAMIEKSEE